MEGSTIFISSCSRRELARRRQPRSALRPQALLVLFGLAAGLGALIAARGGI
jgi:hypothetical protein